MPREPASQPVAGFVPIITEATPPVTSVPPIIEVTLAGAVVRVGSGMDDATLTAVMRAVRASASRP
jgi:transposase